MVRSEPAAFGIPRSTWIEALAPRTDFPGRSEAGRKLERFIWENGGAGAFTGSQGVARLVGVSHKRLLEATEGQPFRRDFGRNHRGRPVAVLFDEPLLRWALGEGARRAA
jgi:hypothetical protein